MRAHRPAFSMIELLVALALFALVVATLSQSIHNALYGMEVVKADNEEEPLYRFALRQILMIEERELLEDGGTLTTPDGRTIDWEAELEVTDILDLFTLRLELSLPTEDLSLFDRQPERRERLYIFRPGWALPDERDSLKQAPPSAPARL